MFIILNPPPPPPPKVKMFFSFFRSLFTSLRNHFVVVKLEQVKFEAVSQKYRDFSVHLLKKVQIFKLNIVYKR